ncbi:hypothetical protein V1506DRAFT_546988 [Lipomyces tetrasporus]
MHTVLVDTPHLAGDSVAWLTQDRKEWLSGRYVSVNEIAATGRVGERARASDLCDPRVLAR